MSGYIRLFRKVEQNPVLSCDKFDRVHAWIYLIERANFKPVKIKIDDTFIQLDRGQLWTSIRNLAKVFGWSINKTRRFLHDLERAGMIKAERNTHGTRITVENYTFYQGDENTNGTRRITVEYTGEYTNGYTGKPEISTVTGEGRHTVGYTGEYTSETQDKEIINKYKGGGSKSDDSPAPYKTNNGDPRYYDMPDNGGEKLTLYYEDE